MAAFDDTFSSLPITLPVLAMLPCFPAFIIILLDSYTALCPPGCVCSCSRVPISLRCLGGQSCTEPSILSPAGLVWVPGGLTDLS